ncbi:helix-turn-helix domain-containing protein [Xylophilus sp. Kf1]|nr:helix-turn-helix domain-containing protein [Xylophilus sp. Kf1]
MSSPAPREFPVFSTSAFAVEGSDFSFDLVRLEERPDIPRGFLHRHDYYHLLWMSEAEGTHVLDFEHYAARANTVFFVSPGQLHAWESTIPPRGFVVNFSADFLVRMFPRAGDIASLPFFRIATSAPVLHLTQDQHDDLQPLLLEIEREFRSDAEARMDVVQAYLLVLLTRLRRLSPGRAEEMASPQRHALTRRFQLLVDRHYLEFERLGDYARGLHTTERQLADAVRQTLGKTAGQVIQDRRMLEAKRLLCNTAMGVAEVGFALRFEDHAYFSRFFKKQAGVTPLEFKRRFLPAPSTA